MAKKAKKTRCWGDDKDPRMRDYHDREWGTPLHDDRKIFEFLILEGMQAGLSWKLVLDKRENFRRAFRDFDPEKVARFGARDVRRLLGDAGIIRNRLKILGAINNAQRFLEVQTRVRHVRPLHLGIRRRQACAVRAAVLRRDARADAPLRRPQRRPQERAASSSSGRPSSTRTCRRPAWSTITS